MNRFYSIFIYLFLFVSTNMLAQILPSDVVWNDEETGYYILKNNNIILVSTKGESDKIILPSSELNNIDVESFTFSKSKNKVLLFTESVKVWRYKTRGDYWVYDFEMKKLKQIGKKMPSSSLMFAKFSPDEKFVAYVSKEKSENEIRNSSTSVNMFLEDLQKNTVKKLYYPSVDYKEFKKYQDTYLKTFNSSPNEMTILAYDALGLIYYAWKKNGKINTVNDFSFKRKIKGKIGTFSFDNKKIIQNLSIYKAENKKFTKF